MLKVSEERVREEQGYNKQRLIRQLWLIVLSTIGVFIGFRYLVPLFFPFLIAYLIAKLIMPLVNFLRNRIHFPLFVSSIFSLILTLGVVGVGLFYLTGVLFRQLKNFLNDIPVYAKAIANSMNSLCDCCDHMFGWKAGQASIYLDDNMNSVWDMLKEVIMPIISEQTINLLIGVFALASVLLIVCIAIINLIQDYDEIKIKYQKSDLYKLVSPVTSKLRNVGIAYVKTQLTIMSINSVILVAGFMWLKSPYSVLAGIGIAVMDAFPVLGSGLFLIPIAIIKLLERHYFAAAVVITMYILCEIIRSLIEPRMLGDRIGLHPFFTLMAMFVGFRLFGVLGFFAGPLGLVIIKTIVEEGTKEGGT